MIDSKRFVEVKYELIKCLLSGVERDVLDISYETEVDKLKLQIVLLAGSSLADRLKEKVQKDLPEFDIACDFIYLSKEKFNENKGNWQPSAYRWLDTLLLSKAEVI